MTLLRQLGCYVQDVHAAELGYDLLVSLGGHTVRVEVKDGSLPPSARRLTDHEEEVRLMCRGRGEYIVVESEADAIALANLLRGVD
jgi:hypothetical protein